MTVKSYFSSDYNEAREKFINVCCASSVEVESHQNPSMGPDGEKLYTDVALLGRREANEVLILCSGTHGVEGLCGSGIQTGLVCEGLVSRLKEDQRVVVIHSINPYGFAHLRRTNEDNVDLNRNFVDHSTSHRNNHNYDVLASAIAPETYWHIASGSSLFRLWLYQLTRGKAALQAAISSGQYEHPQGLFYGGKFEVWSNQTLQAIVKRHVPNATQVAFVDFHTGLGPYGYGEIITNSLPGSPAFDRAAAWWGERVKTTKDGGAASADLDGSVKSALSEFLPKAQVTAVSLEFGTHPALTVFRAMQAENWLHHHGGLGHYRAAKIKARMRRVFYPGEKDWKVQVWQQANEVIDKALAGLSRIGR